MLNKYRYQHLFLLAIFFLILLLPYSCLARMMELKTAEQYRQEAQFLSMQNNVQEAGRLFEKAAEIEQTAKVPKLLCLAIDSHHASMNYKNNDFDKALENVKRFGEFSIQLQQRDYARESKTSKLSEREIHKLLKAGHTLSEVMKMAKGPVAPKMASVVGVYAQAVQFAFQGDYDNALIYYNQALSGFKKSGEESVVGFVLTDIGMAHLLKEQYEKAIAYLQQALEIDKKLGNKVKVARQLNTIGLVYKISGQYTKAIEYYKQALKINRQLDRKMEVSCQLNNIGLAYYSMGQYDNAEKQLQAALQISKKNLVKSEIARQLSNLGVVYYSQGQLDSARENFEKALRVNRALEHKSEIAKDLNNIGMIYKKQAKYDLAQKFYLQADQAAVGPNNLTIMNNIAGLFESLGQHDKAYKIFSRVQALKNDNKSFLKRVVMIGQQMNGTETLHDLWKINEQVAAKNKLKMSEMPSKKSMSEKTYKSIMNDLHMALAGPLSNQDEEKAAKILNKIGSTSFLYGNNDQAIHYFNKALEMNKKAGNLPGVARDHNDLGHVYNDKGLYKQAIEQYRISLKVYQKLGKNEHIVRELNTIGSVYESMREYGQAIKHYQRALAVDRKIGREIDIARELSRIGTAYIAWEHYPQAIAHHLQAIVIEKKLGMKENIAKNLNNIGRANFSLKKYNEALKYYQQALEIDQKLGMDQTIARDLSNIGTVYDARGLYDKAIKYYKNSIRIKEKIRQTATVNTRRDYLASQIDTYQYLASSFLRKGDHQGVLDAVEQSRARVLAERIAGVDLTINTPTLAIVQEGLSKNEAILLFSNINRDRFILMVITDQNVAVKEIAKDSFIRKSRKLYKEPILIYLEKQRLIKRADTEKNSLVSVEKKQQADFETAVHYYRTLLTAPNNKKATGDFAVLFHKLLIEPADELLAGKKQITIMADGILGFLPFETLVNDKTGKYLVQNYDLQYTQSLTIDRMLQNRVYTDKRKPILAMGGAVYEHPEETDVAINRGKKLSLLQQEADALIKKNRSSRSIYRKLGYVKWADLPGTLMEVNEISTIIKGGDIITGNRVSERQVKEFSDSGKLADYKIIHFATHGLVIPELPEFSALVLTQYKKEHKGEDGFLRVGEIAKLKLAADFVNLSACETGLGKIYSGEGIVGLTQSFLIAGANGLSVSLWQVADDSTAIFMTELYKKVENTGISYSQAMTEVKRQFINGDFGKQYQAPFFWSPFVYYGK